LKELLAIQTTPSLSLTTSRNIHFASVTPLSVLSLLGKFEKIRPPFIAQSQFFAYLVLNNRYGPSGRYRVFKDKTHMPTGEQK